jgi:integrase
VPAGATDGVLSALGIARPKVVVPAAAVEPAPDVKPIDVKPTVQGRTLREAIERRIAVYRRDNRPTDRMVNQTASRLDILADVLGADCPVREVTRDHLRPIVEALQDLPARWRTWEALGDGSIVEKAERARELKLAPLAPETVKAHLAVWRSFFEDEGVVPSPVADFKVRARRKRGGQKRDGFTDQEVGTVFASALFQGALSKDRPYDSGAHLVDTWHFWAPLIACFTGARIGEIAQLRPQDVVSSVEHGQRLWALRITEEGEGERRLKNAASERVVPIHAELRRIGLLRLAEKQKAAGAATLLPGCPKPVGGDAGKQLSKWMSENFVKRLGIKREGMGFHFFRHTLTTWLRAAGVPKDARKMLAGRSMDDGEDDSDDGYGTWTMTTLDGHLQRIAVPSEIGKIRPRLLTQRLADEKAPAESMDGA